MVHLVPAENTERLLHSGDCLKCTGVKTPGRVGTKLLPIGRESPRCVGLWDRSRAKSCEPWRDPGLSLSRKTEKVWLSTGHTLPQLVKIKFR